MPVWRNFLQMFMECLQIKRQVERVARGGPLLDSRRSTQRMNAITLARAIRRPGDTVELDFQNPLHREWILSLYDGEETVKRQLPAFHDAYTRTVKTPLVSALPRRGDFVSGAEVEGVHWERNGNLLSVRAASSLSDTALFIDEQLEIRTAAGERVDSYARSTADAHHTVLTLETEFDPAKFQSASPIFWRWTTPSPGPRRTPGGCGH